MRTVMRVVDDVRKPDRGHERVLMARGVGEKPQMHAVAARQMMGRLRRTFMAVRDVRNRIEPEAEQHREQSSSQPLRRCTDPMEHAGKKEGDSGWRIRDSGWSESLPRPSAFAGRSDRGRLAGRAGCVKSFGSETVPIAEDRVVRSSRPFVS